MHIRSKEACKILGICANILRKMAEGERIETIRLSGQRRYKDISSGLNFKRKGLKTILERAMRGDKLKVVVAHRNRLARVGVELIRPIIEQNGGQLVVLSENSLSPTEELTKDLLTILHVFSCRMPGLRNDKKQVHQTLSNHGTKGNL